MSVIRSRYGFPVLGIAGGVVLGGSRAALFHPSVANAQELKQIKLTEKHMQGFIAVSEDRGAALRWREAKINQIESSSRRPRLEKVKQNGFASLAEYDDVSMNIATITSGIDQQTKKFTEPPDQIKQGDRLVKSDKSIPDAEKKEDLVQLEAALKAQSLFSSRKSIALVLKDVR